MKKNKDVLARAHQTGTRALAVFASVEDDLMESIHLLSQAEQESNDAIAHHQARLDEANATKRKNQHVLGRVRELTGQQPADGSPA